MWIIVVDHLFTENLVERCRKVLLCHWEDSLAIPVIILMFLEYDCLGRNSEQGLVDLLEAEELVRSLEQRGPELMLDHPSSSTLVNWFFNCFVLFFLNLLFILLFLFLLFLFFFFFIRWRYLLVSDVLVDH